MLNLDRPAWSGTAAMKDSADREEIIPAVAEKMFLNDNLQPRACEMDAEFSDKTVFF